MPAEPSANAVPTPAPATASTAGHDYIVVARRYRPQTFGDLVGQGQVSQALGNAITTHRVGHAYLFTGARGVGKTSTARIFAKALNCEHGPTPQPCNTCDICESITAGSDVDVLEIDGASNRGIDEIRQLRSNINVRPSRARFKIYIIDEVHMLTTQAFNALLKTLEEPPEHVKFIFCTTDPEKMPITVLSRCQRFDFAPVEADAIVERLRFIVGSEQREADDEALRLLARRAGGSMRDSQSLLEQLLAFAAERITVDDVHRMLGTARGGSLNELARSLVARDAAGALGALQRSISDGVDPGQLAEQLLGYFRDAMAAALGSSADILLHTSTTDHAELQTIGRQLGAETLLAILQILDQAIVRMRQSPHVRTLLEMALVRICRLEDLSELSRLIGQIRSGAPIPLLTASAATSSSSPAAVPTPATTGPSSEAVAPPAVQKKTTELADDVRNTTVSLPVDAVHRAAPVERRSAAPASLVDINAELSNDEESSLERPVPSARAPVSTGFTRPAAAPATRPAPSTFASPSSAPSTSNRPPAEPPTATARGGATTHPATQVARSVASAPSGASGSASSANDARDVWQQALELVEGMTADYARVCEQVQWAAADRVVATFRSEYTLHKQACEKTERRLVLEQALSTVAGRPVRIECELAAAPARTVERRSPAMSRVQRLRELEKHPLVHQAKTVFDAEVIDIAESRGTEGN